MSSRFILLISLKKIASILSVLVLTSYMAGCGGGGGSGGGGNGDKLVTIAGKVDDGTTNSPISGAKCEFVDLDGEWQTATTAKSDGNFQIGVAPDQQGYIRCRHPDIAKLKLSTFISTEGLEPGNEISGQDVTPATTVVADIIHSEDPAVPQARKLELMDKIEKGDAQLNLLVDASTILAKAMLVKNIDVFFGGGPGDGPGVGGGVGGDTGDGADFSPIPRARCEFVAMELDGQDLFAPDLKEGEVLYDAALSDFCKDGMVDRPDLEAIAEEVNEEFEGRQAELIAAFESYFTECAGHPYRTIAEGENSATPGRYFLPIPPDVQGFVRCMPPNKPGLKLATFVSTEGLADGSKISGQDVTPATTFFSHSVATELSDDLRAVKENYLDDIAGLGDVHIVKVGEAITHFRLQGDPTNSDVGLVAFSATSLFNILFKNGTDVDYLATLDSLIKEKEVDSNVLVSLGISIEDAEKWAEVVNTSNEDAGTDLDTSLNEALSKARIRMKVTDTQGGVGIQGVDVRITGAPSDVECEFDGQIYDCDMPLTTNAAGEVILTLTGVKTEPVQITVEASSMPGEAVTKTTEVVAFATVDMEIALASVTSEFYLQVTKTGDGDGTVTSNPSGINCGADCEQNYDDGTVVQLTATANAGSTFTGWSGDSDCSDGRVTMDSNITCTADFTIPPNPECEGATCATFIPCNPAGGCVSPICASIVEGGGVCMEGQTSCSALQNCTDSSDCPGQGLCVKDTCCEGNVCVQPDIWCVNISGNALETFLTIDEGQTIGGE